MKQAVLWDRLDGNNVSCRLCSHRCTVADGKRGFCRVRENRQGTLYSLNYEHVCAAACDPVEKKPLFHFLPGSRSFSISCPGCNFRCDFCQNWQISQGPLDGRMDGSGYEPAEIVDAAQRSGCSSIAYTYTEPTIFMELCADCGIIARQRGIKNVFVSNGYMTREAVDFAGPWLDAINIDLKSFREDFYTNRCRGKLEHVLDTIEYIGRRDDIWLEVTTLIVPGVNDSEEELSDIANFIAGRVGQNVPWHISRFFPNYKANEGATPKTTLEKACSLGKEAGLNYIYVGNMPNNDYESTFCCHCRELIVKRAGYNIVYDELDNGKCKNCGSKIAGIWS